MLNIIFDNKVLEEHISNPSSYFDDWYEDSWFQSDLAKEIVLGIDLTEYIDGDYFKSPVFGGIPAKSLSTGCKATLMLLNCDDIIISGERFGDNCLEYVLKIAELKDIRISMHHWMPFPEPFNINIEDYNKIITTQKELIWYYMCYRTGEEKPYHD